MDYYEISTGMFIFDAHFKIPSLFKYCYHASKQFLYIVFPVIYILIKIKILQHISIARLI